MSELDDSAKLFEDVFNSKKRICPVCGKEIPEEDDLCIVAYRIRKTVANIKLYGYKIVLHHLNTLFVDSNTCAERVSRSWETDNAKLRKEALLELIRNDIQDFYDSVIEKQSKMYSPQKNKRKK